MLCQKLKSCKSIAVAADLAFRAGQLEQTIQMLRSGVLKLACYGKWEHLHRRRGPSARSKNVKSKRAQAQELFEAFVRRTDDKKESAIPKFRNSPEFCALYGVKDLPLVNGALPEKVKGLPSEATMAKFLRMPRAIPHKS